MNTQPVLSPGSPTRPRLGLVCITSTQQVRYRTVTRKHLLSLESEKERHQKLHEIYAANIERLGRAIDFCITNEIFLYRITSNLFPFADDPMGKPLLAEYAASLADLGRRATEAQIRLVMHPDQFVVLSSDSPTVRANSIKILSHHARVMDLLQQPRSPWAMLEIHGGKGDRADRLVEVIGRLPAEVRSRLALENDERAYSAAQILDVCRRADVPMVFDAHHHICREGLESYEHPSVGKFVEAARHTWPDPLWQIVHISNGRESFCDRRHSELIHTMPDTFRRVPWIEVEAKSKEEAIDKLRQEWTPLHA